RREGLRRLVLVHVAQRVDVRPGLRHAAHVVRPHPADADAGDVDRVAGRANPAPEHVPRYDRESDAGADVADECPSRDALACHSLRPPNSLRPPRMNHGEIELSALRSWPAGTR